MCVPQAQRSEHTSTPTATPAPAARAELVGGAVVRLHPAEGDRLDSLASYGVLDSPPDPAYDALTTLAARLCGTPFAAITLVDATRQWFKSSLGLTSRETPREMSICSDVVADGLAVAVPDAAASSRHRSNPLVTGAPHLRAYLGVPLVGRDGLPLGTLCVMDARPRLFTTTQRDELGQLAQQVVALLEQDRRDLADGLRDGDVATDALDAPRMRAAIEDGDVVPHFQPVVDIRTGRPHQLEALARWVHPVHGILLPAAFMPAVEASSLVVPLGRSVLDAALTRLVALEAAGVHLPGGVAVNVASGQLARGGLARDVRDALDRHQVRPGLLTLEITETTKLRDPDRARRELAPLREHGVRITLDDFGVGWSNLARLRGLPVDGLKIDRALVGTVLTDPVSSAMVTSTVALAKALGLQVTAEGIESASVWRHLEALGCDYGQGWHFGRAVDAGAIESVLRGLADRAPVTC